VVSKTNDCSIALMTKLVVGLMKRRQFAANVAVRRDISKAVHSKQYAKTERFLTKALVPVIKDQTEEIVEGVRSLSLGKSYDDQAASLISQVYNPDEWFGRIVDAALPVLAKGMVEAAVAFLLPLGVDLKKKSISNRTKASTASRWLEENADWDELVGLMGDQGLPIRIMTEIPLWMQQSIREQLETSFKQPYWNRISETTGGDAERLLSQGLAEGHSINRIASGMREHFASGGFRYARARSENIARTEAGNALNGARDAALSGLKNELGEIGQFLVKTWLSVLGNTTRDTHADLDGVPADVNGEWNLAGYQIPWPAHYSLPAGERCNCQCTIDTEFGMNEEEVRQSIDEYNARVELVEEKPPEIQSIVSSVIQPNFGTMNGMDLYKEIIKLDKESVVRKKAEKIQRAKLKKVYDIAKKERSELLKVGTDDEIATAVFEWMEAFRNKDPKGYDLYTRLVELQKPANKEAYDAANEVVRKHEKDIAAFEDGVKKLNKELKDKINELIKVPKENRANILPQYDKKKMKSSAKVIDKAVERLNDISTNDVFGGSYDKGAKIHFNKTKSSRDYFCRKDGIFLSDKLGRSGVPIVIHEMGHWIENLNNKAKSAVKKLRTSRTKGSKRKWLGKGYELDEEYYPRTDGGKWINNYMAKLYSSGETEMFSMGLEWYATNPLMLAKKDPRLFKLMVDITRGNL